MQSRGALLMLVVFMARIHVLSATLLSRKSRAAHHGGRNGSNNCGEYVSLADSSNHR